jgi:Tol biopolymer transport system component/predicted Ser/Thr protein kinase
VLDHAFPSEERRPQKNTSVNRLSSLVVFSFPVPIQSGSRLGPYEILEPLGAGGMGEVWRARDTRLDRSVAIKVLPAGFAANAQMRMRFEREAKTISQLNHPNICHLYDVGDSYLVMELLDGETLADRLARGRLPIEQVLRYGIQIAGALDRAHRQGIVHRDLKPGNVMLTKSGAKLLDFGLAKIASEGLVEGSGLTQQKPLTQEGTILGTFQYMAPEQVEGQEADARTDIFALGVLLYEMAAGKRPFEGKSRASLIASILEREPEPISSLQPMTPPAFERVVKGCLAKEPDQRWQTAHDVGMQLEWIAEGGSQAGVAAPVVSRRKTRDRLALICMAVAFVAAATFGVLWWQGRANAAPRLVTSILAPEKVEPIFGASGSAFLSPDGKRIAFVGQTAERKRFIFVRPLNADIAQPLAGTEGARWPFWSSDSRQLGFFANGKLKKIEIAGGPPQSVCDAAVDSRGAAWSGDTILFAPSARSAIFRVSDSGGTPVAVTQLDPKLEYSHRFPSFLPDGKHFLFMAQTFNTVAQQRGAIYAAEIGTPSRTLVTRANSPAQYANGYVLFCRDRVLLAQRFDAGSLKTRGEPLPLAEKINYVPANANAVFSATDTLLVYSAANSLRTQLTWFDRTGRRLGIVGAPGFSAARPHLSHDGRRIAMEVIDEQSGFSAIWVYDIARGSTTRLTFDAGEDLSPVWSPDDQWIAYSAENLQRGTREIHMKRASGGEEKILLGNRFFHQLITTAWSPDGKTILFYGVDERPASSFFAVYGLSIASGTVTQLVTSAGNAFNATFSPDGRWLAYQSNESGDFEVYVQPFPPTGEKWQVSSNGGGGPLWRNDGRELLFGNNGAVFSVDINTSGRFDVGPAKSLFPMPPRATAGAVTGDAQRFLIALPVDEGTPAALTTVLNWTEGLKY